MGGWGLVNIVTEQLSFAREMKSKFLSQIPHYDYLNDLEFLELQFSNDLQEFPTCTIAV